MPERAREVGPERHDHHEVEDVDELHRADQQHDGSFARGQHGRVTTMPSLPGEK